MTAVQPSAIGTHRVERLDEILTCATDLFARKGFDLTTIDDVAEVTTLT